MTKKKHQPHKSAPKDFSNSPFKNLKGLSALETESSESSCVKSDQKHSAPMISGNDEAPTSFLDEMACLGVRRLKDGEQNNVVPPEGAKPNTTSAAESQRDESDLNNFLNAIGSMEKVFKDEWCGDVPDKRAVPRRMKQVERGQLKPEDELDLHGMTVNEATGKVLFFLQNAIFQGFSTVILITGKGLNSEGDPVLRSAMERLLNEKKEQVVEWGVAPRRYGGEGALVVFLRQPGQKNP